MPAEGVPWDEFVETKFGGKERAASAFARVAESGAPDGIEFRFDLMPYAPNSLDAHRLVLLAAEHGREWEMVDALYAAYFTHGRNINNIDELVSTGAEVGFDAGELRAFLESDRFAGEVMASQHQAESLGVQGVPFFVIDDRYALSGA